MLIMLGRMTEKKKTYIVDDFIAKVRSHYDFQTGPLAAAN